MKPRKPATPTPEPIDRSDGDLFRDAIGPVRPLRTSDATIDQRAPAPAPEPMQFRRDEAQVMTELLQPVSALPDAMVGEELLYVRDGHDPRLVRRLRRGQIAVQDEIDLHQMNLATARECVRDFLAEAVRNDRRCVRIVHGKGLRSRQGPVLKTMVDGLLRQHGKVIAFASPRHQDGGTGAVLVLLQRQ